MEFDKELDELDKEVEEIENELEEEFGKDLLDTEDSEDQTKKQKTFDDKVADSSLVKQNDVKTAERYQDILKGLGFTRFDNTGEGKGIACKLKKKDILIGRTFTDMEPVGHFWAKNLEDTDFGKKGLPVKFDQLKKIPIIQLFYKVQNGELEIPELEVTGKIVKKSEKAIQVQFTEFNQIKTEWWGLGAVKKNNRGETYIPAGFSKETPKYGAKMSVPRDIIISEYEEQIKKAPQNRPQKPQEDHIPDEVATNQHEKEEADQKTIEETAGKQIIDDMGYFILEVKENLLPLFNTDEMTQAEVNELIRTLSISAGIEYGYRIRNRRF